MLSTFTYSPGSCIRCGGANGYELAEGDIVQIFLNQARNVEFPEWIEGIVVGVTQASVTDTSRTYTVQYETDDLDDAALLIAGCDVMSLICTSWREILQAQFEAFAASAIVVTDGIASFTDGLGAVWILGPVTPG